MSNSEFVWTVAIFVGILLGILLVVGWAWYWALLIAFLGVGVAAGMMGIK